MSWGGGGGFGVKCFSGKEEESECLKVEDRAPNDRERKGGL